VRFGTDSESLGSKCKGLRDVTEKCGTNVWQGGERGEMCRGVKD